METEGPFWNLLTEALKTVNDIDSDFKLLAFTLVLLAAMTLALVTLLRTQAQLVKWILSFVFGIFTMVLLLGFTAKTLAYYWDLENQSIQTELSRLEGGDRLLTPLDATAPGLRGTSGLSVSGELSRELENLVSRSDFYTSIGARPTLPPELLAGRLAFFQADSDRAQSLLSSASDSAQSKEAFNDLGVLSYTEGDLQQADDYYRAALEIDPNFPNPMNGLGLLAYEAGRNPQPGDDQPRQNLEDAITWFNQALELDPEYGRALNNRALAQRELGFLTTEREDRESYLQQAIASFSEAAAILPNTPEVQLNLGLTYSKLGDEQRAIAPFRQALELRPDYAQALNDLAKILAASGDPHQAEEAVDLAERAVQLRAEDPGYLDTLAHAYFAAGRIPEARETGLRALGLARQLDQDDVGHIERFVDQIDARPDTHPRTP